MAKLTEEEIARRRRAILVRDRRCVVCGSTRGLVVHELVYRSHRPPRSEETFSDHNMIAVCLTCHIRLHEGPNKQWFNEHAKEMAQSWFDTLDKT